jgi:8-oxo-dGTP diphosphatase
MQEMTLCFLARGNPPEEILLGVKRAGFGEGKVTGFGGKVEDGETTALAAVRELREEIGIQVREKDLLKVAQLQFIFPARPAWDQAVHVFLVVRWQGKIAESMEMAPLWCGVNDIPYARMWDDATYWLPRVVAGERMKARFIFRDDNETVANTMIETWEDTTSG